MLRKLKTYRPLLLKKKEATFHKTDTDQKEIIFIWVTGDIGFRGNEAADRAADIALDPKKNKKHYSQSHVFRPKNL